MGASEAHEADDRPASDVQATVDLRFPPGLTSRYATNFVVQKGQNEYFVSFFEAIPPVIFGRPPEGLIVPAECVARIIIAHDRLPELIRILLEVSGMSAPPADTGADKEDVS